MKNILQSYIRNEIPKSEFSDAICNIEGLEKKIGRPRFLHLKHGDKVAALQSFQELNECDVCSKLHTDDLAHSSEIRKEIDGLAEISKITRVHKPSWYTPHLANKNPYGAQGFYKCTECSAIIEVCEPERMYRGCCEVIG